MKVLNQALGKEGLGAQDDQGFCVQSKQRFQNELFQQATSLGSLLSLSLSLSLYLSLFFAPPLFCTLSPLPLYVSGWEQETPDRRDGGLTDTKAGGDRNRKKEIITERRIREVFRAPKSAACSARAHVTRKVEKQYQQTRGCRHAMRRPRPSKVLVRDALLFRSKSPSATRFLHARGSKHLARMTLLLEILII